MTLQEALNDASTHIARRDAEVLLAHVLHQDRTWLFLHNGDPLAEHNAAAFDALVQRRASHEPMQYITGVQEFFGLPLRVTPATLIPRPETEHLVEAVLAWAAKQPHTLRLLDVGTGTGAIALALATHLPAAHIFACDLSTTALEVARDNAKQLGLEARVQFKQSDLLNAFAAETSEGFFFDAIVSNPPYIPIGDAAQMQPEVRDFEPHTALFAGGDGLKVYRRLIPQAHAALRADGLLAIEIGFGQQADITKLLAGWNSLEFIHDYADIPRVALARKPS